MIGSHIGAAIGSAELVIIGSGSGVCRAATITANVKRISLPGGGVDIVKRAAEAHEAERLRRLRREKDMARLRAKRRAKERADALAAAEEAARQQAIIDAANQILDIIEDAQEARRQRIARDDEEALLLLLAA